MLIKNLSKAYEDKVVLKDFTLEVEDRTITCIMGESGCGKTTLLNMIAQSMGQTAVSYLFQEPRLLPWRTVLENVAIPLKGDTEKARRFLDLVGLSEALDKYPAQLSGGMSQRVAMARAFSYPAKLVLMDEPFQNLDVKLKDNLLRAFLDLWDKDPAGHKTVLWVTHNITEACLAADKVLCMAPSPLKVTDSYEIKIARSERTAESMAQLQARIYNSLVNAVSSANESLFN